VVSDVEYILREILEGLLVLFDEVTIGGGEEGEEDLESASEDIVFSVESFVELNVKVSRKSIAHSRKRKSEELKKVFVSLSKDPSEVTEMISEQLNKKDLSS
jgi:hypothetical protein